MYQAFLGHIGKSRFFTNSALTFSIFTFDRVETGNRQLLLRSLRIRWVCVKILSGTYFLFWSKLGNLAQKKWLQHAATFFLETFERGLNGFKQVSWRSFDGVNVGTCVFQEPRKVILVEFFWQIVEKYWKIKILSRDYFCENSTAIDRARRELFKSVEKIENYFWKLKKFEHKT